MSSAKDHSTATLNVIRAAMDLAERDEGLGLVTMEQIQSIQRTRFAPAERKQLAALLKAEGKSNREIAKELEVSKDTVANDLGRPRGDKSPKNGDKSPPEGDPTASANGSNEPKNNGSNDAPPPTGASDGDGPDIESEVEPENYRTAFLIRADHARKFAVYSGPIDDEVRLMARQVATAWTLLTQALNNGGSK